MSVLPAFLAAPTATGANWVTQGRGLVRPNALVEVVPRVPKGVVCLLSALRFHDLATQSPFEVWLAIDNNTFLRSFIFLIFLGSRRS
jgi:hypothetical protein